MCVSFVFSAALYAARSVGRLGISSTLYVMSLITSWSCISLHLSAYWGMDFASHKIGLKRSQFLLICTGFSLLAKIPSGRHLLLDKKDSLSSCLANVTDIGLQ